MKKEDLFETIGGIDDRYISAAEEYKTTELSAAEEYKAKCFSAAEEYTAAESEIGTAITEVRVESAGEASSAVEVENRVVKMPKRRTNWVKWMATAACICLVLGFGGSKLLNKPQAAEGGKPIQGSTDVMQPQPAGNNTGKQQPAGNNTDRPQTNEEHEKDAPEQTQKAETQQPQETETQQRAEPRTDYENEKPAPDKTEPFVEGFVDGVFKAYDFYISEWNGKTVWSALAKALDEAPADKLFDILAKPYIDYDFVYEGKTLAQYYSDMCDERNLPEVLMQLLKCGDSLKYGTLLYEGGAPNGEKWAKEWYEDRIAFFGRELLDKYIVNGEFLAAQVKEDAAAALEQKEATKAYKIAFAAYYKHLIETLQISRPADVKAENGLVLHMTAEEFKNFMPEKVEAWTFIFEAPVIQAPEDLDNTVED